MASENIINIESWVENANSQLNSMSQNFAEIEVNRSDGVSTDLLNLLEAIEDIRKEYELIKQRYKSAGGDQVEMADTLQFHLDSLEKTFELLTKSSGGQQLTPGSSAFVTP